MEMFGEGRAVGRAVGCGDIRLAPQHPEVGPVGERRQLHPHGRGAGRVPRLDFVVQFAGQGRIHESQIPVFAGEELVVRESGEVRAEGEEHREVRQCRAAGVSRDAHRQAVRPADNLFVVNPGRCLVGRADQVAPGAQRDDDSLVPLPPDGILKWPHQDIGAGLPCRDEDAAAQGRIVGPGRCRAAGCRAADRVVDRGRRVRGPDRTGDAEGGGLQAAFVGVFVRDAQGDFARDPACGGSRPGFAVLVCGVVPVIVEGVGCQPGDIGCERTDYGGAQGVGMRPERAGRCRESIA